MTTRSRAVSVPVKVWEPDLLDVLTVASRTGLTPEQVMDEAMHIGVAGLLDKYEALFTTDPGAYGPPVEFREALLSLIPNVREMPLQPRTIHRKRQAWRGQED